MIKGKKPSLRIFEHYMFRALSRMKQIVRISNNGSDFENFSFHSKVHLGSIVYKSESEAQ